MYLKVIGLWRSVDDVPNYITDWDSIMAKARPGFTVLVDLTKMKTPSDDVKEIHQKVQKQALTKGMKKVAEVVGSGMGRLTAGRMAKESGMISVQKVFDDFEKAEAWLDE